MPEITIKVTGVAEENVFDDVCCPCDITKYEREFHIVLCIITISFIVSLIIGAVLMTNGDKNIAFPFVIYGSLGMLLVISLSIFRLFMLCIDA